MSRLNKVKVTTNMLVFFYIYMIILFGTVLKVAQSLSFRRTPILMSISTKTLELGSKTTAKQVDYHVLNIIWMKLYLSNIRLNLYLRSLKSLGMVNIYLAKLQL